MTLYIITKSYFNMEHHNDEFVDAFMYETDAYKEALRLSNEES